MKRRSIRDVIRYLFGRRSRYVLSGKSMLPTLKPETYVFVCEQTNPQEGDIIVAYHPHKPQLLLIKRLESISAKGLWIIGDNPQYSTDSRSFGWVPEELFIGVVCSYW